MHATRSCRADVLMLMMGGGLPRENCWTEPDPASNLQRMHPSTQATVPPVPLPLVPVRWGRLTKPLYQFVHMIILGIQSILIFHHLLNMKEKRSILIFQGFEAAAAIKLFSAKIGSSHILFRRADSGSRGCIYAKQDKSTGQNRHPLQRPTGKQNMSNELAHCYIFIYIYSIYISLSLGNIDDRHRHTNINIREIIWLGDYLRADATLGQVLWVSENLATGYDGNWNTSALLPHHVLLI